MHYVTKERVSILMQGWTKENKIKLYNKMKNKGIDDGGILNTTKENTVLFNYLTDIVHEREIYVTIKWKDDGEAWESRFWIGEWIDEDEDGEPIDDDNIFFYVSNEEELDDMIKQGENVDADFIVLSYKSTLYPLIEVLTSQDRDGTVIYYAVDDATGEDIDSFYSLQACETFCENNAENYHINP